MEEGNTLEEEVHGNLYKMTKDNKPPRKKFAMAPSYGPGTARRGICTCLVIFLILAGAIVLTLWLVYRPQKPKFTVVGAAIYDLNTSSPPLISTTIQFTIVMRNPNKRVSIYYDKFYAFVSYRGQAITPQLMLPPLFLHKKTTVAMSPVLGGQAVAVSPEVVNGLAVDEAYGVVGLRVVLVGSVRWKAGAIKTAHYGLYVKCDVLVGLKKGVMGQIPLLGSPGCKVDV